MEWSGRKDTGAAKLTISIVVIIALFIVFIICALLISGLVKICKIEFRLAGTILLPLLQGPIYNPGMDTGLIELGNFCCPVCLPVLLITAVVLFANQLKRWLP